MESSTPTPIEIQETIIVVISRGIWNITINIRLVKIPVINGINVNSPLIIDLKDKEETIKISIRAVMVDTRKSLRICCES